MRWFEAVNLREVLERIAAGRGLSYERDVRHCDEAVSGQGRREHRMALSSQQSLPTRGQVILNAILRPF